MVSGGFRSPWRKCFILSSCQTSTHTVKHDLPTGNFTGLCLFSTALQRQMRLSPLCLGSLWHFRLHLCLGSSAPCAAISIHFRFHSLQYFPRSHHYPDLIMSKDISPQRGWSCYHDSEFDGGIEQCLFLLSEEYLLGFHGL